MLLTSLPSMCATFYRLCDCFWRTLSNSRYGLLKDARSLLLQQDTKLRSDRDAKLRIVDTFIATLCGVWPAR